MFFFEEKLPYKIINEEVIQLMTKQEEVEILDASLIDLAGEHIKKAVNFFDKRPIPDYENTISESLKSIEAMAKKITNDKNAILDRNTIKRMDIHPALGESLLKMYGWAGDESGVRHANKDNINTDLEVEARFALSMASAVVNFLENKNKKSS